MHALIARSLFFFFFGERIARSLSLVKNIHNIKEYRVNRFLLNYAANIRTLWIMKDKEKPNSLFLCSFLYVLSFHPKFGTIHFTCVTPF